MDISCAFATSMQTPGHVKIAEDLGYVRAWAYDSPPLYPDVWAILALAAERTSRIGLGPGVLVPSLRHPMTNAAAIAMLHEMAPGRVYVGVGAGFTGRRALGQKPMRFKDVEVYVRALRGLLAGETVEWEGAPIKMLHGVGFGSPRPIKVPILIGAGGPVGAKVAMSVGDGTFAARTPNKHVTGWQALLLYGTVLDEGEDLSSPRVADAAAHGIAVRLHSLYEAGGADAVRDQPGGAAWLKSVESMPSDQRHLAVHEGHLVNMNEHDKQAYQESLNEIKRLTLTGTPSELRERVAELGKKGTTEIVFQPAGANIPGELERFMAAVG